MSELTDKLQRSLSDALSEVPADRWTTARFASDEACTIEIRPAKPDAAQVSVTMLDSQAIIEIANLVTMEAALASEEDLQYLVSIVRSIVDNGVIVTLIGSPDAPALAHARVPVGTTTVSATSVEPGNLFSLPRFTKRTFAPY